MGTLHKEEGLGVSLHVVTYSWNKLPDTVRRRQGCEQCPAIKVLEPILWPLLQGGGRVKQGLRWPCVPRGRGAKSDSDGIPASYGLVLDIYKES